MKKMLMTRPIWIAVVLFGASISVNSAIAEDHEVTANHPPVTSEPEKVYVESANGTYRSTKSDEYCFYNEEHDHIHCYDEDPEAANDRGVVVESAVENRTYRSTRRHHDPIATGIGVGIAIGLPILVHHAIHDRRYYSNYYGNYSRNYYQNHRSGLDRHNYRGDRRNHHGDYRRGHRSKKNQHFR
ncbi:MAG: hypothetical protein ACI9B8_000453 [Sulfitobacter sp.]|jgi:hypothetical protein